MLILAIIALAQTPDLPLTLACGGRGSANKPSTTQAWGGDSDGNGFNATLSGRRSQAFEDQVDLVIDADNSRIRMPRTMLPPLRGGDDGWFKLKDLKVTAESISGSAAVNFINKPKVHIDRRTGSISISGKAGDYSGQCERVEAGAAPKF